MNDTHTAPASSGCLQFHTSIRPPASIAKFIEEALEEPIAPPSPTPPPVKEPPKRRAGIWATMTPEERSAWGKHLASRRNPANMARKGRTPGTPNGWNHKSVHSARLAARLEAEELVSKLQAKGIVQPEKRDATIDALATIASPGNRRSRVRQARAVLREFEPSNAGAYI